MLSTGSIISTRWLLAGVLLAAISACASRPSLPYSGDFIAPLDDIRVESTFGRRGGRPHYGLDLKADIGTPVAASASGRVAFAGVQRGFGNIVILDHGRGITTYYAHLADFAVRRGAEVRQGDTVGFVGVSGNATGPHLHFELRQDGKPLDPLGILATLKD